MLQEVIKYVSLESFNIGIFHVVWMFCSVGGMGAGGEAGVMFFLWDLVELSLLLDLECWICIYD